MHLSPWVHPSTGEKRLYINGTSREKIYFSRGADGGLEFHSQALDTSCRGSSSAWKRRDKDCTAAGQARHELNLPAQDDDAGTFNPLFDSLIAKREAA